MKAIVVGLFAIYGGVLLSSTTVSALGTVVFSQLQTGDTLSATNEAVELYNNTANDMDISGWCVRYMTAASQTLQSSPKYCFTPPDSQTQVFLSAQSYASIVTTGYVMPGGVSPDGRFSGSGMAASGGHVRLIDGSGVTRDTLGWGTAVFAEGYIVSVNPSPAAPSASQALSRKLISAALLQDTDNNRADFELKTPAMKTGGIYEFRTPIDLCGNIPDIQELMPSGYAYDEAGNCELLSLDKCFNIGLIQTAVPDALTQDTDGSCYTDTCSNLEGLQRDIPDGYRLNNDQCVKLESRGIWFSELLPNVSGSDVGQEFIELYNPNDEPIDLTDYTLQIGKNLESSYELASMVVPSHGFLVFHDDELGFTLLNTSSSLRLVTAAGNIVSEISYANPIDDQSWALIGEAWQYTNQLTPLAENLPMLIDAGEVEAASTGEAPCPAGKYRHPITNRCRNIETDTTMLVACDADEYRNLETNRCRKIATLAAVLAPCSDGYERNLETNRCRKAETATSLTSCQSGYERNPETNRCRKASALAAVASTPAAVSQSDGGSMFKNALIVTAGLGAAGYGLYEWRSEMYRGLKRLVQLISSK